MATLNIKNFPAALLRSIKARAAKEKTTVRSVVIQSLAQHTTTNADATLHTISEPMRKALGQVQDVFVELERSVLVSGLRESRERTKAKLGRCEGRKRYGEYLDEAAVLTQIRSMRKSGMTHQAIAAALDSRGIPARLGGVWRPATISKILRRSA